MISIDLSGEWFFRLDPELKGLEAHYEKEAFSDTIILPTTTAEAKKGTCSKERATGYLTEPYHYEGYAWYQRQIEVPYAQGYLLSLERTRISHVYVDDIYVGSQESFVGKHEYDLSDILTAGSHTLTIMIANVGYATPGGHMTSPDTQTNWNGILGEMTLSCYESARIQNVKVQPDYATRTAHISLTNRNFLQNTFAVTTKATYEATVRIQVNALWLERAQDEHEDFMLNHASHVEPELTCAYSDSLELTLNLQASGLTWNEWTPRLYELVISIYEGEALRDSRTVYFGMREFTANDMHFHINGIPTYLRGKHDGMIFPRTGYAPMDLEGWLKVMSIAKDYGINHYRYHTCCPPDAAFLAADLLGIYMQPELSFWGTLYGPKEPEYNERMLSFLRDEGFRIIDTFSNHPSFVMMTLGNELWGNTHVMEELIAGYRKVCPQLLYAQGSNNFFWTPKILSEDDFFSGVRFSYDRQIRGSFSAADVPYGCIQSAKPGTTFRFDDAILPPYAANSSNQAPIDEDGYIEIQYGTGVKKVKASEMAEELIPSVPVIAHEVGQYQTYPDYKEIPEYTGVLKPYNFEIFRERLSASGLASYAEDYFKASGALSVSLYKEEIETMLRSRHMAGFQLLDLQDFAGQGTALVGMLNAFYQSKGLISAKGFRHFCSDAVLMAEFPSYLATAGEDFVFTASVNWAREELPGRLGLTIKLSQVWGGCSGSSATSCADCDAHAQGLSCGDVHSATIAKMVLIDSYGYAKLGDIHIPIPESDKPLAYTLTLSLKDTDITNSYTIWTYPSDICKKAITADSSAVVHSLLELSDKATAYNKLLLFLEDNENPHSIEGFYTTDFWNYGMFRSIAESIGKKVAPGTLGLLIDTTHPALAEFPTRSYSTPQWFDLVMHSRSTILDGSSIVPIVRTIDNVDRNHNLGLLYELHLTDYDCDVLVCTANLPALMGSLPEAAQLYLSLVNSMKNPSDSQSRELPQMSLAEFKKHLLKA